MGFINISAQTMFDSHPWPTDFMDKIDGSIKKFHQEPNCSNTCASEISYALNSITGHIVNTVIAGLDPAIHSVTVALLPRILTGHMLSRDAELTRGGRASGAY